MRNVKAWCNNNLTLDEALEIVIKRLETEQSNIICELEARINPNYFKLEAHRGVKRKNDYRTFFWISVEISSRTYWITLFYNDIDKNSGNPHTQIGRIQFWRNIQTTPNNKIGTPHRKCTGGQWRFIFEHAKPSNPPTKYKDLNIKLYDKTYSPQIVVDEFFKFLEACGEINIRKL